MRHVSKGDAICLNKTISPSIKFYGGKKYWKEIYLKQQKHSSISNESLSPVSNIPLPRLIQTKTISKGIAGLVKINQEANFETQISSEQVLSSLFDY
jgi:hypothetical protein